MVVGAYAVAFHAKPRYTKDLDLFVEPTETNAGRIVKALDEFGFGSLSVQAKDLATPGKVVWIGAVPNRIDFLTEIEGVTFDDAWAGRVAATYGSQPVHYIGKSELIRNKRAAGRPQDRIDVEWLTGSP